MAKKTTAQAHKKEIGSAFDLLGTSWEKVKANWQAFAVVNTFVILGAVTGSLGIEDNNVSNTDSAYKVPESLAGLDGNQLAAILSAGILIVLIVVIIGFFLAVMETSLSVKAAAGKKPSLAELFNDGKKYFFRLIGLYILLAVIVTCGLILLIVPGVFAIGRLVMAPYHLVDKDLGIIEAMKQSNEQAKGRMMKVYAAIGVMIVISIGVNIIGVVPVIGALVGAVVTIGFSLVLALRYQQLKHAA